MQKHTHKFLNRCPQLAVLVLLSSLSAACSQPADDPKAVADKYWQYLQTGNNIEAKKLVSVNSRRAFNEHSDYVDSNTQITNNDTKTVVSTSITKFDVSTNRSYTTNIETILLLEQGKWKVDASQSQLPIAGPAAGTGKQEELQQLAEELSESMQENIESIDDAMDQGMQMLDDALQQGSKEMSQSLLQLMNELNSSMQESIDRMKQRRQQQLDEQRSNEQNRQQQPQPDPRKGEGMI